MPEMVGWRLARLVPHDRLEFVEKLLVALREMGQRGAKDRRHVFARVAGVRVIERIEQFLEWLPQHQARPLLLRAVQLPHPFTTLPPTAERARPDEAEELRKTEDARMPVQDVRHHGAAAPSGA